MRFITSGVTAIIIFEVFKLPTTKCEADNDTPFEKRQFNHVYELEQRLKVQDKGEYLAFTAI